MNAVTNRKNTEPPMVSFRRQLEDRLASFAEALPEHISPQRFKSVMMGAVLADPNLIAADRPSLFEAALAAANDGLLPDKREGAMVIYNTKVKDNGKDVWIKKVQWMPMVRGILTKLYNTGLVRTVSVGVAYGGDSFRAWTDDTGDHMFYEEGDDQDRKLVRRVFAQVVMKDGGIFVETMRPADIEKIRSKSKSKDSGPWVEWWEEMAIKSTIRRMAKRLPMARDIMPVLERDDSLYQLDLKPNAIGERAPTGSLSNRLDELAGGNQQIEDNRTAGMEIITEDGEIIETNTRQETKKSASNRNHAQNPDDAGKAADPSKNSSQDDGSAADGDGDEDAATKAFREGKAARRNDLSRKSIPAAYRKDETLTEAFLKGFDGAVSDEREPGEEG